MPHGRSWWCEGLALTTRAAPLGDLFSSFPITKPRESLTLENRPNLEILNPLYDLTPPTCITAVVTEVGVIPPNSISSIPVALGRLL